MQNNALTITATRIRDWQQRRGISDTELCKRFAGLGSTKTFKRILEGDTAELDLERWFVEYEQVWTLMELESISAEQEEPIYDDLRHMLAARLAVQDAMAEKGNNRLVIIEGPSGSGKTTAARSLAARFGRKVVLAEADETWKESLNSMLGGILRAIAVREIPASAEARKTKLISALKASPVCLVIDEAHHLGPRTLNLVKTIINQSRCQVVFVCIETLFRKLECAAYEEAKQLTKNRLAERVRLTDLDAGEVEKFLDRRFKWEPGTIKSCARTLAERAQAHGYWNFVNLVARRARELAGKDPLDQDTFIKAVQKAQQSR
jgi:type II secretory pathway predicted ATPase ExeA